MNYLASKGYEIIKCNFRQRFGEIDLIAQKDGVLAFCEVKRSRYRGRSSPELRVDRKKQIKLARCARAYLSECHPDFQTCRFDIITIKTRQGRDVIEHFENAFWPPEGWDEE